MGRKSKIDLLGLTDRVIFLFSVEHKTNKEIHEILKAEGAQQDAPSVTSIQRTTMKLGDAATKYQAIAAEARVLIDAVRSTPNLDVIEATMAILNRRLFEFVQTIDALEFADAEKMIMAISRMAESQAKVAKLRLDFGKGFEAAKKAVLDTLRVELNNHPELMGRLSLLVGSMEIVEA